MDSPVFGNPPKSAPIFKKNSSEAIPIPEDNQQMAVYYTLLSNFRKLTSSIRRIQMKYKRQAFQSMSTHTAHQQQLKPVQAIPSKKVITALLIQIKLLNFLNILESDNMKKKLSAWGRIKVRAFFSSDVKMSSVSPRDHRLEEMKKPRKTLDWKQNSSHNILDLSGENKRLKNEMKKSQMEQESFREKMNSLLEMHEKPRYGGQGKKKK